MEKSSPHYVLATMQAAVATAGISAFTLTALRGGAALGLTTAEMLSMIAKLSRRNFYKSMTTIHDHRVWQDVYHAVGPNGRNAYIKLTLVAERIVIQFKEQ